MQELTLDRAKVADVLNAMRGHAEGWSDTRAQHTDEDGEIPEEFSAQVRYDQAEEDAALDVLHALDGWIELLDEALAPAPRRHDVVTPGPRSGPCTCEDRQLETR